MTVIYAEARSQRRAFKICADVFIGLESSSWVGASFILRLEPADSFWLFSKLRTRALKLVYRRGQPSCFVIGQKRGPQAHCQRNKVEAHTRKIGLLKI